MTTMMLIVLTIKTVILWPPPKAQQMPPAPAFQSHILKMERKSWNLWQLRKGTQVQTRRLENSWDNVSLFTFSVRSPSLSFYHSHCFHPHHSHNHHSQWHSQTFSSALSHSCFAHFQPVWYESPPRRHSWNKQWNIESMNLKCEIIHHFHHHHHHHHHHSNSNNNHHEVATPSSVSFIELAEATPT